MGSYRRATPCFLVVNPILREVCALSCSDCVQLTELRCLCALRVASRSSPVPFFASAAAFTPNDVTLTQPSCTAMPSSLGKVVLLLLEVVGSFSVI